LQEQEQLLERAAVLELVVAQAQQLVLARAQAAVRVLLQVLRQQNRLLQ
jgi:hypothetical protein